MKWIANIHFTYRGQEVKTKMKSMNKDWYKKAWTMDIQNMSWVDYTGKPSSDKDIQLMVYSVRS